MPEPAIPKYEPKKDRPPRGKSAPRKQKTKRAFRPIGQLQDDLNNAFGLLGIAFAAKGDMHCAGVIADNSEALVASWCKLAERNDGVRRVLEWFTATGQYGSLLFSTLAVALPIMQHHGLIHNKVPVELFSMFGGGSADDDESEEEPEFTTPQGAPPEVLTVIK